MSPATTRTIICLVDAGGAGGGRAGGDEDWSLLLQLAGWRHPGSEVVIGDRDCEMAVSEDELESLMEAIRPYSIIEAEFDEEATGNVTILRRIMRTDATDAELERLADQLGSPIVIHDDALGRLEYNRKFNWYEGRAEWCGREVEVSLSCGDPDDPAEVLEAARALFNDQTHWQGRVRDYAVEQLLPLKNEDWLDEDEGEAELSAEEFLARMSLQSISVSRAGRVEFWHDDGDLFYGHSIQISGTLSEGPTKADIPG